MRFAVPLLLVLSACASPAERDSDGSPSPADGTPTSGGSPLTPASEQPTRHGGETSITGVIGFDDIEGGCGYLEAEDGTRYEVIWPDRWELRGNELRDAGGRVVARVGDEVTVHGHPAEGMASICQIGPMFQAVEVDA